MNHRPTTKTLDRALSRTGAVSRKQAGTAILAGRVMVNGRVVTDPRRWVDPAHDRLALDGRDLSSRQVIEIWIHNKPRGVIVSRGDPDGRSTVYDQMPSDAPSSLRAVGRLDQASAGLLIFTNDTRLADRLLDKKYQIPKHYRVKLRPDPGETGRRAFAAGVDIGDARPTGPVTVEVEQISPRSAIWQLGLTEGRNRQIRRMAKAVGSEVEWLVRVSVGPLLLGELKPGRWRRLTATEMSDLKGMGLL